MDASRRSEAWIAALATTAAMLFLSAIPASVGLHRSSLGPRGFSGAPSGTASLSLLVRRSDGHLPVASATARAFWSQRGKYFLSGSGTTDSSGRLELVKLPMGPIWLLVEAKGLARSSTSLSLGTGPSRVELSLEPSRELRVRVESEAGAALAGATVLVTSGDALPFGALTAPDGVATVGRLGAPPWKLRVAARGFDQETRSDVLADTTVRLRPASSLEVLVVDETDAPKAGASVLIAGSGLWPARRLETGADGRAKIGSLVPGAYDLKAQQGSLVSKTEFGIHLDRGEAGTVKLVLVPGRMIPIVVTDGAGKSPVVVPNADVLLVEGGVSSFPIQGRTNGFGRVVLGPVASGQLVAAARADGFVSKSTVAVPEPVVDDVQIPLVRGGTLRGEVVDRDGHPIGGATVEVVGTDLDGMPIAVTPLASEFQKAHFAWALAGPAPLLPAGELGVMPGPVPPIPALSLAPAGPIDELFAASAPSEPWVTAEDGNFRATPVPPGRVRAIVRHPSFVESTSDMVTLGPGGSATVRVVMEGGGGIDGTVVDEVGRPVPGARVEASAALGTTNRSATTGDDGTFSFATLPADVLLTVARPGEPYRPVVRRRVDVPDGKRTELKLTLPSPRGELEISAEDDSSRPVKMAQVTVLSLDPDRPLRETAFTDDGGRATVKDAVGLPLSVLVEAPGFARWARQLDAAPATLRADLASGIVVAGHVTAVRGRRDVEGATVELLSEGHRKSAFTDSMGHFRFDDVSPGPVHLAVSHHDYATVSVDVAVASTGRADRAFDVDAIDLPDPGVIEGRVVDAAGAPVAGARVGIGAVDTVVPVAMLSPSTTATTGPDGAFRLDRARPGKVSVEAYAAAAGRGRVTVTVDAGRTSTDATIVLSPSGDDTELAATGGVAVTLGEPRRGVTIVQVAPGSEAEHAGLVAGDVIELVDGATPASLVDARRRLAGPEGTDVVIAVRRGDGHVALRVRRERVRQ